MGLLNNVKDRMPSKSSGKVKSTNFSAARMPSKSSGKSNTSRFEQMDDSRRKKGMIVLAIVAVFLILYIGGLIGMFLGSDVMFNPNPINAFAVAFGTRAGRIGMLVILILFGGIFGYMMVTGHISSDMDQDRNFKYSNKDTYGSGKLLSEAEYSEFLEVVDSTAEATGMIIGTSTESGRVVAVPLSSTNNRNSATCGQPGSMKSRSIVRNMIMQFAVRGHSVFMIDPKGELLGDMAAYLRAKGYKVIVWNIKDHWNSNAWNMLGEVSSPEAIDILCDAIINNTLKGDKGDHFFDGIEGMLLKSLCLYVFEEYPEGKKTIGEAYILLQKSADELDAMFENLRAANPASAAAGYYNAFCQSANNKGNAILGLMSRMTLWMTKVIQMITGEDEIKLADFAKEKTAFFCIVADDNGTYNVLSTTLITMMFTDVYRYADSRPKRRCDVPVDFILDEFPNVGQIPDFVKKISTARSRDIGIHIMFQSIPQMANRYPNEAWKEILGACNYNIYLGCNETTTSKYYSELTGVTTVEVNTERRNYKTIRFTNYTPDYSDSSGVGQRPVEYEDEVRQLENTELLLFVNTKKPIKLNKMDFTFHVESLLLRQVAKESLIPDWRIDEDGNDLRMEYDSQYYQEHREEPKEEIVTMDEYICRELLSDKNIVVRDSDEYGPTRTRLVRECVELRKKYGRDGHTPNGQPFLVDKHGNEIPPVIPGYAYEQNVSQEDFREAPQDAASQEPGPQAQTEPERTENISSKRPLTPEEEMNMVEPPKKPNEGNDVLNSLFRSDEEEKREENHVLGGLFAEEGKEDRDTADDMPDFDPVTGEIFEQKTISFDEEPVNRNEQQAAAQSQPQPAAPPPVAVQPEYPPQYDPASGKWLRPVWVNNGWAFEEVPAPVFNGNIINTGAQTATAAAPAAEPVVEAVEPAVKTADPVTPAVKQADPVAQEAKPVASQNNKPAQKADKKPAGNKQNKASGETKKRPAGQDSSNKTNEQQKKQQNSNQRGKDYNIDPNELLKHIKF